jgi:RNase P subunit RPR2
MQLDSKQSETFKTWLNTQIISRKCEVCRKEGKWILGNKLVAHITFNAIKAPSAKAYLPMLYTICKNCGHVRFFDSRKVGIVSLLWEQEENMYNETEEW